MILDQSVFFGVADAHDRHRDMRLDVDNMSYEVNIHKTDLDIMFICLNQSLFLYNVYWNYRSCWLWKSALEM
jgi:hypothetical protein